MRVLHLSRYAEGGAARYASALSDGLYERGIESSILTESKLQTVSKSNQTADLLNRVQSRLFRDVSKTVFHGLNKFGKRDLASALKGFDIVHIHQVTNWIGLNELVAAIPDSVYVFYTIHDLWPVTGGCVVYNGCGKFQNACQLCPVLKSPFNRFLASRQLRLKSKAYSNWKMHVVANSHWTLDKIQKASSMTEASSFSVVPPAVDSNIFQSLKNTRKELRIPDDAFVIITGAGSITDENKDIPKALEIASRIAVQRPVKMLVFGDGQLETPSNLDVHFCGPVSDRSLLAKYMNAADVLVSTSKMETYGMTMIEAMSCGTPVVAFGNGAISEVVEDGVTGLLSTSDNDSDLVKKLSILANDKALACRLGSQGQKLVQRRNEIGSFVDSYVRLYEAAGKTVSLTSPDLYHVSTN